MRVLIIGGTGFIGPYVVTQLRDASHDVTLFHRGQHESSLIPPDVRHVRHDSASMPVLQFPAELLRESFDVVVHMIAMGEADARAAVDAFSGRTGRLVALSSGDVYLAYGRFTGLEPGPVEHGLLTEDSPLRTVLYPYRAQAKSPDELSYYYEKLLVEKELLEPSKINITILRLPKVYGPGNNADFATVYPYGNHPQWRWTHGYVENVAAAIVLAASHSRGARQIYNVGEEYTPTIEERLESLPQSTIARPGTTVFNFRQNIAYDTTRIRRELGYAESISYEEGLRRTLNAAQR